MTKQNAKNAKVANVTTSQMLHCSIFLLSNNLSIRASFLLSHFSVFFSKIILTSCWAKWFSKLHEIYSPLSSPISEGCYYCINGRKDTWNESYLEPWIRNQRYDPRSYERCKIQDFNGFEPGNSQNQITAINFQFASLPSIPSHHCNANFHFPVTLSWLQSSLLLDESHWEDKWPPSERNSV